MTEYTHIINSTVPQGFTPIGCLSTTRCTNLNADLLDDQEGSYYLNTSSGSQTKTGALSVTGLLTLGAGIAFTGAQTIQTTTGTLTLATGAANGNITLSPHGSGSVVINAILNAVTGYQVNGAAATGTYLRCDGTKFAGSAILGSDISGIVPSANLQVVRETYTVSSSGVAAGVEITIPNSRTYTVGTNKLMVFVNGILQTRDSTSIANDQDYWESSTTGVEFTYAMAAGTKITFLII